MMLFLFVQENACVTPLCFAFGRCFDYPLSVIRSSLFVWVGCLTKQRFDHWNIRFKFRIDNAKGSCFVIPVGIGYTPSLKNGNHVVVPGKFIPNGGFVNDTKFTAIQR